MRGLLFLALAFLLPVEAGAVIPPPPPNKPEIRVFSFAGPPASVTCGSGVAHLVEGAPLPPKLWQVYAPPVAPVGVSTYTPPPPPTSEAYSFSVDPQGQVIDLKRAGPPNVAIYWSVDDQAAIIASWRFAPGAGARDCRIDLAPTHAPLAQTSPARLFELLADEPRNTNPALRQALAADGDCYRDPRRRPQMVVYPDLRPFENKTVDPPWAGVRYDIDANGAVRNVRVVAQHGETAFADASASAIAEARFFGGSPRTGCYATFKATPRTTEAPKRPDAASFERPGDDCKVTREALNIPENKFYPPAFGKRQVAGWAIVRFDVAPWGQIGAIEVLAAQPAAQFGDAARMLLMNARPNPPPTGYRGCVVPIIYAIPAAPEDEY